MEQTPKFLAVDFFCGAGGTTRGLIDAGGYVVAGVDKDESVLATYTENNANRTLDKAKPAFLNRDIFPKTRRYSEGEQSLLINDLRALIRRAKRAAPGIPVLFAICAPCQPFTTLAKKTLSESRSAGRKKDRGLLGEAAKFVEEFKPDLVLSENVAGIGEARYGGVWKAFERKLQALGYSTATNVVDAYRFGIPQYRKRSILLAAKSRLVSADSLAVPEADPNSSIVSVRDALSHLPALEAGAHDPSIPNHRTRSLSELNKKRLALAKPGQSNAYMKDTPHGDLSLACHNRVNKKLKQPCFTDVYTRMHPDRPSPTITTKCYSICNGRFGHFDQKQIRGISLREAAVLQSFPLDYVFYPPDQIGVVGKMIGNAVPPKLAQFFASHLLSLAKTLSQ